MVDPVELPASVNVNINGTIQEVPIFGSVDASGDYTGYMAVPSENIDFSSWNAPYQGGYVGDVGSTMLYTQTTVANKISVGYSSPRPYTYDGFAEAYEAETGQPYIGVAPLIFVAIMLFIAILVLSVAYMYFNMQKVVKLHAIDKSTEFTEAPLDPNDPSNCWYTVCKGNTCTFLNKCTGETKGGPVGPNPYTDTFGTVMKYGLIIGGVVAGAYVLFKLVIPSLQKKPEGGK